MERKYGGTGGWENGGGSVYKKKISADNVW